MVKKINEDIELNQSLHSIIEYLCNIKNNKIAHLILKLKQGDVYPNIEDINYLALDKEPNMISYTPANRRNGIKGYDVFNSSGTKSSIRVGRAVKKIIDTISNKLNLKIKCNACFYEMGSNYLLDTDYDIDFVNDILIFRDTSLKFGFKPTTCNINFLNTENNRWKSLKIKCDNFIFSSVSDKMLLSILSKYSDIEGNIKSNLNGYTHYAISNNYINDMKVTKSRSSNTKVPIEIEFETELDISNSEIEEFTNEFTSLVKTISSSPDSKIEKVSGVDIVHWYLNKNYSRLIGKLGNSCMGDDGCKSFFGIYTKNPNQVSLLIIRNQDHKLLGRALLWKVQVTCENLPSNMYFMDRIYTINDSDDNIFINYAIENGYIYRNTPNNNKLKYYHNGKELNNPIIYCQLDEWKFDLYPYLDTLKYLNISKKPGLLSNKIEPPFMLGNCVRLDGTEGNVNNIEN